MRNKKKFNEFMNKTIDELKDEKRYGTAHIYQSTLNAFSEFCGCEVIYFHQLNRANLKEFETYLRDKQLSWNTVSTYMRTLRATYNKAVDKKNNNREFPFISSCLHRREKRYKTRIGSSRVWRTQLDYDRFTRKWKVHDGKVYAKHSPSPVIG